MRGPEKVILRAARFAAEFSDVDHPDLRGVSDGKAVGTYIERRFKEDLAKVGIIEAVEGNAAKGIDLPSFEIDIKVTSIRQPQSSSPFGSFRQKVEGLGYNLLLFVYDKDDGRDKNVTFVAVRFIPSHLTADHQTTLGLRQLILESEANADDVFAYLVERNIPTDEGSLYEYAESLVENPPVQGYLTVSNALQWRLQYSRIVGNEIDGVMRIV